MRKTAAFKMLFHDRAAAIGSISGVIAIIFLVGQQLTIFFGLLTFMSSVVDISGADIWILSRNADNANSSGTIPAGYRDRIMGVEGVENAEPIIIGGGLIRRDNGNYQAIQIIGVKRPRMLGGPNRFHMGGIEALLDYEGVTVEYLELGTLDNPDIGTLFEINQERVRVRAITRGIRGFSGNMVFTNMEKARELTGIPADRYSSLLVNVAEGYDIDSVIRLLRTALPWADVYSKSDLSVMTRLYYLKNTGIGGSFGFSTLMGALVGVVIIALTMYTNVMNKQRDYAMLRALGGRRRDVLYIIFIQTVYIAFIGILIGFTLLSVFLLSTKDSELPSYMPWWAPPLHALFTFVLCLLGSITAMRRAVSIEPATVFR